MFPEYYFRGVWKNAAFKHCSSVSEGGLGWVVGIGVDNDDIYAAVSEMRRVLIKASVIVLGIVVLVTVFIARRTTRPILELERHTRRVAGGDLDARIERYIEIFRLIGSPAYFDPSRLRVLAEEALRRSDHAGGKQRQLEAVMGGVEAERVIEGMGIGAGLVRGQLNETATGLLSFRDRVVEQSPTQPLAPELACGPNGFDLPAPQPLA